MCFHLFTKNCEGCWDFIISIQKISSGKTHFLAATFAFISLQKLVRAVVFLLISIQNLFTRRLDVLPAGRRPPTDRPSEAKPRPPPTDRPSRGERSELRRRPTEPRRAKRARPAARRPPTEPSEAKPRPPPDRPAARPPSARRSLSGSWGLRFPRAIAKGSRLVRN